MNGLCCPKHCCDFYWVYFFTMKQHLIITAPKRSCGKVMLSQEYVRHSVPGEGVGTSHASWDRSHGRVPPTGPGYQTRGPTPLIAHSAVQSSTRTLIHSGIFARRYTKNTLYTKAYSLIEKPYWAIIDSVVHF